MIQDKIFFDEKDPTGLSYNTPFTYYGSYQGRLWSKSPSGSIQYYTQNSDLSAYATTGSNQFSGSQTITGSLTVTGTITGTVAGTTATASYVEYTNVANKPALVSGSSQVTYSGLTGIPSGIVSGSAQVASFGIFATTGSNGFNGSQSITGSLTVTGQVVAQTLNVQQVTSSVVYSSGSNIFGNSLSNTQQFTGSVGVTGSLSVNGAGTFSSSVTSLAASPLVASVSSNSSNDAIVAARWTTGIGMEMRYNPNSAVGFIQNTYPVEINQLYGDIQFRHSVSDTMTPRMIIKGYSGNVGIGIDGPSERLEILGPDGSGAAVRWRMAGGRKSGYLYSDSAGVAIYDTNLNDAGIYLAQNAQIDFRVNGSQRMIITSGGNVGIGTTSPTNLITLQKLGSVSTTPGIDFRGTLSLGGVYNDLDYNSGRIYGTFDSSVYASARVTIATPTGVGTFQDVLTVKDKNVGIGTISPGQILDIVGTTPIINIQAGANNNARGIQFNYNGAFVIGSFLSFGGTGENALSAGSTGSSGYFLTLKTDGTERMRITSTGLIYLGSDASGAGGLGVMYYGGGFANQTTLDANTRFQGPNTSVAAAKCYAWNTYSDQRIKENINPLSYGLNEILQLNPVSYNQHDSEVIGGEVVLKETYKPTIGLIAQEVNNSIPEAVGVGNDTELWGLDYDKLVPVLVKAIQELSAKIETLEAKIQTLEQQ